MNYYNPYFYSMPIYNTQKVGLLSRIFGRNVTFSSILNGSQKVLNVASEAIPLIEKVKPMANNAKTMFKIMNEFKRNEIKSSPTIKEERHTNNNPTFFQ